MIMLERSLGEEKMEHDPTADRNREPAEPDNNMNVDDVEQQVEDNNEEIDEDDDAFADDEFGPQEFSALNSQLDQLQSALDSLESRNDDIHSKLLELLRSSREIRQVMVEENSQQQGSANSSEGSKDTFAPSGDGGSSGSVAQENLNDGAENCRK